MRKGIWVSVFFSLCIVGILFFVLDAESGKGVYFSFKNDLFNFFLAMILVASGIIGLFILWTHQKRTEIEIIAIEHLKLDDLKRIELSIKQKLEVIDNGIKNFDSNTTKNITPLLEKLEKIKTYIQEILDSIQTNAIDMKKK